MGEKLESWKILKNGIGKWENIKVMNKIKIGKWKKKPKFKKIIKRKKSKKGKNYGVLRIFNRKWGMENK